MPNAPENKSQVGFRDLYYALVTQNDVNAYSAGTPQSLAPAVNAQQAHTVNTKLDYADDSVYDVLVANAESKITLETTNIPLQTLAVLLGQQYDTSTGSLFDNGGIPPEVALSFRSRKANGKYRYRQYLSGKFSMLDEEVASQADTPDPKHRKILYTAYKTIYQWTGVGGVVDGVKKVDVDEDATGAVVTNFFASVRTPVVGSAPAFTVTPAPADGAIGQATNVAITLTFSNALAGNAELGVTLTRWDTQAIVAVTRSLSADRKTATLAHAALTATKQYVITLANVKDIYGQALGEVAYDFTCT